MKDLHGKIAFTALALSAVVSCGGGKSTDENSIGTFTQYGYITISDQAMNFMENSVRPFERGDRELVVTAFFKQLSESNRTDSIPLVFTNEPAFEVDQCLTTVALSESRTNVGLTGADSTILAGGPIVISARPLNENIRLEQVTGGYPRLIRELDDDIDSILISIPGGAFPAITVNANNALSMRAPEVFIDKFDLDSPLIGVGEGINWFSGYAEGGTVYARFQRFDDAPDLICKLEDDGRFELPASLAQAYSEYGVNAEFSIVHLTYEKLLTQQIGDSELIVRRQSQTRIR